MPPKYVTLFFMYLPRSLFAHMPYQADEFMDLHAQSLEPHFSPVPLLQRYPTLPGPR